MTAGVVVKNMFVFPCHRGLLSGRWLDWPAASRHDSPIGSLLKVVKVSAVLVDVTLEPVDSPVGLLCPPVSPVLTVAPTVHHLWFGRWRRNMTSL